MLNNRDELRVFPDDVSTFKQGLRNVHCEWIDAISHLLNLVQKLVGSFPLYTWGPSTNHVVALADLIKEIPATPVV